MVPAPGRLRWKVTILLWFYANEGKREGPVEEGEIQRLHAAGAITAETLVWNANLPDWRPFAEVAPSLDPGAPPSQVLPHCAECGQARPMRDLFHFGEAAVCGQCKLVFLRRLKQATVQDTSLHFAGFWIRLCAKSLDFVILGAVQAVGMEFVSHLMDFESPLSYMFLSLGMVLLSVMLHVLYNTWFLARYGATPGKMALGLRVLVADGSPISFARALARALAELISGLVLYIGYLMVAFDSEKRSLHDLVCDTRVIRE